MGQSSALSSMNRVMESHGDELTREVTEQFKSPLIKEVFIGLVNSCYEFDVTAVLTDGTMLPLHVDGFDIDSLAERFPDCEVGY